MGSWNSHIKKCLNRLKQSEPTLKAIYEGIFIHGEMICFEYEDGSSTKKMTFDEADLRIRNAAYSLSNKINGEKDSYIALNLDNSPEWVMGFWAIILSGNKPYLVNKRQPSQFVKKMTDALNIKYSLDLGKNDLGLSSISFPSLGDICPKGHEFVFSDEFALSTSGTSLKQKICLYSGKELHEQMLNSEYALNHSHDIKKRHKKQLKQLAFLPFYHIFGFIATYLWFTYFGCAMVFLPNYHPDTITSTIKKHGVTHVFGVPMLWHTIENKVRKAVRERGEKVEKKFYKALKTSSKLLSSFPLLGRLFCKTAFKEIRDSLFGPSVKYCISGGSYIRDGALEMMNGLGYQLHGGYGASEIGITSVETSCKPNVLNRNGVGVPFPSVEYKLENGVLCVKGESTCKKIIQDGEEITLDEWFLTLDIAHFENGSYFIDGRQSDVIISESGENINPDLLESRFNPAFEEVTDFCVLGLGKINEETSSLIISLSKDCPNDKFKEISSYFKSENEKMSRTYRAKKMYYTYSPLKSPNAIKVSRTQLKNKISDGEIEIIPFDRFLEKGNGDKTKEEKNIISMISYILNIDESMIKESSHFMDDLGGTSLDYFSLLGSLSSEFGIEFSEGDEPGYTPKDISDYIIRKNNETSD